MNNQIALKRKFIDLHTQLGSLYLFIAYRTKWTRMKHFSHLYLFSRLTKAIQMPNLSRKIISRFGKTNFGRRLFCD